MIKGLEDDPDRGVARHKQGYQGNQANQGSDD